MTFPRFALTVYSLATAAAVWLWVY